MEHQFIEHKECTDAYCSICLGGLHVCEVCGLIEASLTSDCPGEKAFGVEYKDGVTYDEAVYAGDLDYREGEGWVEKVSKYAPSSVIQEKENLQGGGE